MLRPGSVEDFLAADAHDPWNEFTTVCTQLSAMKLATRTIYRTSGKRDAKILSTVRIILRTNHNKPIGTQKKQIIYSLNDPNSLLWWFQVVPRRDPQPKLLQFWWKGTHLHTSKSMLPVLSSQRSVLGSAEWCWMVLNGIGIGPGLDSCDIQVATVRIQKHSFCAIGRQSATVEHHPVTPRETATAKVVHQSRRHLYTPLYILYTRIIYPKRAPLNSFDFLCAERNLM